MQDSTLSETGSQIIFLKMLYLCNTERVNPKKNVCICHVLSGTCVLDFY